MAHEVRDQIARRLKSMPPRWPLVVRLVSTMMRAAETKPSSPAHVERMGAMAAPAWEWTCATSASESTRPTSAGDKNRR
jgi:hypothetical protein